MIGALAHRIKRGFICKDRMKSEMQIILEPRMIAKEGAGLNTRVSIDDGRDAGLQLRDDCPECIGVGGFYTDKDKMVETINFGTNF